MTISDLYFWAKEKGYQNKELIINYICSDDYYGGISKINKDNLELTKNAVIVDIED